LQLQPSGFELGGKFSGLSHAPKGLAGRLGMRLLDRTNRNVTLTAAGEALRDVVERPFSETGLAVESLNRSAKRRRTETIVPLMIGRSSTVSGRD
jgi:DNA-binding transcriptional LysR family regulator